MFQVFLEKYRMFSNTYSIKYPDLETAEEVVLLFKEMVNGKKIILWGNGVIGRNFLNLFRELNISIELVIDKEINERGHGVEGHNTGPISILREIDNVQDYILIAAVNHENQKQVEKDLNELNCGFRFLEDGHFLHMLLQSAWCMIKVNENKKINLKNCYECTCLDNTCNPLNAYLKKLSGYEEKEGTRNIKMIGYILGNICTLKCKNCCESVPYMPEGIRGFVEKEVVVKDIEKLSAACEFLTLIEFIGGEPFLHPQLPEILTEVLKIKNVGNIHIFTNATVPPKEKLVDVLKNERIILYLSNYQVSYPKAIKSNVDKTTNILEKEGINYFFGKKQSWMDFSQYDCVDTDVDSLEDRFENCFLHNCNRLYKGKLYVCPHQYAGIQLGKLDASKNIVDIYQYNDMEFTDMLNQFKEYTYIDACQYCGMPYNAKTVLSGEQL